MDEVTLARRLEETRKAVDDLTLAVNELAKNTQRNKIWNIVLSVVVGLVVIAIVGVVVLAGFFIRESDHTNDEFRRIGRDLFLSSCEGNNANKELIRQDNITDGELLITITGAEARDPVLVEQFREGIRQQNARIQDRDCKAELSTVEDGG